MCEFVSGKKEQNQTALSFTARPTFELVVAGSLWQDPNFAQRPGLWLDSGMSDDVLRRCTKKKTKSRF